MSTSPRRAVLLLAVLTLVSLPAFADPDDDGWTVYVPPAPPTGGTVLNPTTPEGGFGAPDRTKLDQALRRGVLDQLCRQLRIPLNYDHGFGEYVGVGTGIERYLRTDVDNQIAIVDDEHLRVSLNKGLSRAANEAGLAVGVSFGASIEGHSMVVRRTGTTKSCDEVLALADLRDVKTVLPMKGDRISHMALGELWRIPMTLTYSEGVGVSDGVAPENAAVNLSFGRSDSGAASMTLYRIADDKLRFRFRIDHVVVWSKSLGLTQTYPAIAFAADAQNILLRFVERELARQLDQYTRAWINFGQASSDGTKILMEFVIDPRDPAQADALAKVVHGDMLELVKMSFKMSTFQTKSTLEDYLKLREKDAALIGQSTYAASDEYKAKSRSFSLNLPLLISHNAASLFGEDKVNRYTDAEGQFHFFRADKSKTNSYLTLPWVGPMVRDNTQRDVETVTFAPKGGQHGAPIMVYIRNRGYLRVTGDTVRGDVEEVNGVMALAGAQRGKVSSRLKLPVEALVPPSPVSHSKGPDGEDMTSVPSDRKGTLSMTLVFNQQAVKDILAAPAEAVLKAFGASLGDRDERAMVEWLTQHGRIKDGKVDYSWREASRAFPSDDEFGRGGASNDRVNELSRLSRAAADLIADLAEARDAKDNEARAQALAKVVGGKGRGDLAYEDVLRVLVQFVDPMDLTGDFVANVSVSTKGVKSPSQHLVLKSGRQEVPLLREAGDAKSRFAEPSILTD
ncbi:MAG: hypothetical protein HY079_00830 [Elusimicrobia bacterium]|nr:hypothetical protein [Elusimicrobiota bacterium]